MSDFKKIVIFAYSGHAYVVVDAALSGGHFIESYVDLNENPFNPYDLSYLGMESSINWSTFPNDTYVFPAIGSNDVRRKMVNFFEEKNLNQLTIIHPKSVVSSKAEVGLSTLIAASAVINPLAKIGKGCIINTSAVVEHECQIGDYSHIAPGAVLAGNVQLGESSFVGANSVVKHGVKIGKNVTIGAGSVVLKDIPDYETWVGNPAKKMNAK